jgi:Peptidase family S41
MRRGIAAVITVVVLGAAGAAQTAHPAASTASDDVRYLMSEIRRIHPNPFHATSEAAFQAAAEDLAQRAPGLSSDQMLVELMRFVALLGERDGHSGIFPLDPDQDHPLHLYPIFPYKFSDGLFVVASIGNRDLIGLKLLAIDGMPVEEIEQKVRPIVPRDNESTRTDRVPQYMITAEVLHGLGLRPNVGSARFTFQRPGQAPRDVVLTPTDAASYSTGMSGDFPTFVYALPRRPAPLYLRRRATSLYVTTLQRGRVVYVGYNLTQASTYLAARKVLRLARQRKVRRVIVDVRLNPGGDNHTYVWLLNALRSETINRRGKLVVLIGRSTFSAAQNFITDVERRTRAIFVGETSGGSPNLYGDVRPVRLPTTGWTVNVAAIWWVKSRAGDPRVATEPHVPVALSSTDFFAARDPALAAALAYRR